MDAVAVDPTFPLPLQPGPACPGRRHCRRGHWRAGKGRGEGELHTGVCISARAGKCVSVHTPRPHLRGPALEEGARESVSVRTSGGPDARGLSASSREAQL